MKNELEGKKMLVLGHAISTLDILRYAKENNIYTIVADYLQNTPEKKTFLFNVLKTKSMKYYCTDNNPNFGFIMQINTGNNIYTNYSNEEEIKKNLFTSINNSKYSQQNFSMHESFQSGNPTFACVYVDNNSHKTYYYAPTMEKPKEFINLRLKMMKIVNKGKTSETWESQKHAL